MASNLTQIEPNKPHTPKWLKYLLILEIVFASLGFLLVLLFFCLIYFTNDPYKEDTVLIIIVGMMIPWIITSFYVKILVKSWKQVFLKYRLLINISLIISLVAGLITAVYEALKYTGNYMTFYEKFLYALQSFWSDLLSYFYITIISSFSIFGLIYGLVILYLNFRKITSIPWWNFIYLPGVACFGLVLLFRILNSNSESEIIQILDAGLIRFEFLSIPLIFLVFLILEYREVRSEKDGKN